MQNGGWRGAGLGGCWGTAEFFVKVISRALMFGDTRVLFTLGRSCDAGRKCTACLVYLFDTFSLVLHYVCLVKTH